MATHTQLGMPPCNFVVMTGKPCPACGMTTSFALLVRGDVGASLRANWAGTRDRGRVGGHDGLGGGQRAAAAAVRSARAGRTVPDDRASGSLLVLMLARWAGIALISG